MEKKQLNLNAPLLSVRRIPSSLVSPNVQNGGKTDKSFLSRRCSLPSHAYCNPDQVTEPVAVPFMWEHILGRPKSKSGPLFLPRENESIKPSILSQRIKGRMEQSLKRETDKKVFKFEKKALSSGNAPKKERRMKVSDCKKESSDSEDDNDAFSDALEILSPTESFSFSCVSDLTEYTAPNAKPFGRFNADPHTQDFMLHRFLPAAKAMALEPTPYVARKKSSEQPREVKEVVGVDKPLPNPQDSSIFVGDIHENDNDESEPEDEVCDSPANILGSACGFLPLFCAKNSACILNPVPDTKGRSSIPKVYASEVRRLARAAYMGPQSQPSNKQDMEEARSLQKLDSTIQSHGISSGPGKLNSKQTDEYNQFVAHSGGLQGTYTPTLLRPSGRRFISPYRNQRSESPFQQGVGFLGIPSEAEKVIGSNKFQGVLPHQRNERYSGSARLTAEKILYIDSLITVHKKEDLNPSTASVKKPMGSADENKKHCVLIIPKASASVVADMLSKSNISYLKGASRLVHGPHQEINPLGSNKVSASSDTRTDSELNDTVDDAEGSTVCTLQSPFPPLPKTPAQSWLRRVLPSVTAKPFSDSRKISRKTSTSTNWETVVRTSKVQYDDKRYSEELTTHFQKHSKK